MCKSSSIASILGIPKRSLKVFLLSEKVKVFHLKKKKIIKLYAEVTNIYGKSKSSIREIVKEKKEINASFAFTFQNAKVVTVHKCLVKMKKALNLCCILRDHIHITAITVYCYDCAFLFHLLLLISY